MYKYQGLQVKFTGKVQGVGFRPTVYRLACERGLNGWVKNTLSGVELVFDLGNPDGFILDLKKALPAIAKIDNIAIKEYGFNLEAPGFQILTSSCVENINNELVPEAKTCPACLKDLFNPQSRYYLYPFTSCTACGPRYTITSSLPYDRVNTSYSKFDLCPSCLKEYTDPLSRRFHAQTTCCISCGPKYSLDLKLMAAKLFAGEVVIIKAFGGYQLIALADNPQAVHHVRTIKGRKLKPLALMSLNVASITEYYAHVSEQETSILESTAAPIVLLKAKTNNQINLNHIAPGLDSLGFMLAYSPLYYLLFYYLLGESSGYSWLAEPAKLALIVTSANFTRGAIIGDDKQIYQKFTGFDANISSYNREIITRVDDSVNKVINGLPVTIRRGRGYAPQSLKFDYSLPNVLALGAEEKASVAFSLDSKIILSQFFGALSSLEVVSYYNETLNHLLSLYKYSPQLIVCDKHPDFYASQLAETKSVPILKLEHHFAHFAASLADYQSQGKTLAPRSLGLILDGYGYGSDGDAWGSELALYDVATNQFKLLDSLPAFQQPGGDLAEKESWRLALSLCYANQLEVPSHLFQFKYASNVWELIQQNQFNLTRGFGRLISGISALLNICTVQNYEPQAALLLEPYFKELDLDLSGLKLDSDGKINLHILMQMVYDYGIKESNLIYAVSSFYYGIVHLLIQWLKYHADKQSIKQIFLSGGVFQSEPLVKILQQKAKERELCIIFPQNVGVNDEIISLGQVWYGVNYLKRGGHVFGNS